MTIEAYLDELLKELEGRMPDPVADEKLLALDEVLQSNAASYVAKGLREDFAVDCALADLGDVQVVAGRLVREYLGVDRRPGWKLSLWAIPFAALAIFMPIGFFLLVTPEWAEATVHAYPMLCGVATWLGIAVIGLLNWRTRRFLGFWIAGAACTLALALFAIFSAPKLFGTMTQSEYEAGRAVGLRMLAYDESNWKLIQDWRHGNPPADQGPVRHTYSGPSYPPLVPLPVPRSNDRFELVSMTPDEAKTAWEQNGPGFEDRTRRLLPQLRGALAPGRPSLAVRGWTWIKGAFPSLGQGAGMTLIWSGLFFFGALAKDRWRNARFRARVTVQ